MKKLLPLFLLLAVLAGGFVASVSAVLSPEIGSVELREEILSGERDAARGIGLTLRMKNDEDTLYWTTVFAAGEDVLAPETQVEYYPDGQQEEEQYELRISIDSPSTGFGIHDPSDDPLSGWNSFEMMVEPARDLLRRTESGEKRTEIMRLRDYYDVYPLTIAVNYSFYPAHSLLFDLDQYGALTHYLAIPVPEDQCVEVTVDNTGETQFSILCNTAAGSPNYALATTAVYTQQAIFANVYTVDMDTGLAASADSSLNRQIHCLPLIDVPQGGYRTLDGRGLSLFHELEEGSRIIRLELLDERLMVFYERENRLCLRCVELSSGNTLQELIISEEKESVQLKQVVLGEGFAVVEAGDGSFCVLETGESVTAALSGTLPEIFRYDYRYWTPDSVSSHVRQYDRDTRFLWDGERLILAGFKTAEGVEGTLHLAVMNVQGLVFHGVYASFMDWESANGGYREYHPTRYDAVTIGVR